MKVYHVSERKITGKMIPRIPKSDYEEQKTPRICFAKDIQGALIGAYEDKDITGKTLYVYSTTHKFYEPTKEEVADVNITGEVWILEPIIPEFEYMIKIESLEKTIKKTINRQEFDIPVWNYKKEKENMAINKIKKDDRYDLSRRNEISRTSNRNEVSYDNEYTERSRKVFEKLAKLATAIAEHFGWEASLVFEDFIKDLALINDPTLRNNLDANNPVDQLTGQLLDMYTEDPEAFNIFRNQAVMQIMNMSESKAIELLEQYFGNRLGGGQQARLANNNYRRINHNEDSEPTKYEGKEIHSGKPVTFTYKELFDMLVEDLKDEYIGHMGWFDDFANEEFEKYVYDNCINEEALKEFYQEYGEDYKTKDLIEQIAFDYGFYDLARFYQVEKIATYMLANNINYILLYDKSNDEAIDLGFLKKVVNDSQSQEIAQSYRNLSEKYDLDFEDLVYGPEGFMNSCYPDGFPDFNGDVIFSEKYWNEFEKWLKDTKHITLPKEENSFWDSKEDDMRFAEKFGIDNLTRYKRLNQKLEGNNKDMTWVIAHIENVEDLNEMLNVAQFGNYTPVAENDKFAVFDIESLQMCKDLAKGAEWCISVPSAYQTNARFGAKYQFYINKINGDKYCVASVEGPFGVMFEIVDKNDNELVKLPDGVPMGENIRSSVVEEDTSNEQALLQTALANVQLLSVDTLRIAYDDMFGEELEMLNDDEVKDWLIQKLQEVDSQELKRYIENHIDDFAIVPEEQEELDYAEDDDDPVEFDLDYVSEEDEEKEE